MDVWFFLLTRSNDGSVVHENHHVGFVYELYAVSAEDPGLSPEKFYDALLHQVVSYVCVHGCQRIVQEVDVFVLRK